MSREILLSATPLGRRAAVVDDGVVSALMIEAVSRSSLFGDIHRGRVMRVVPSLGGGFVALGEGVDDGWLETAAALSPGQTVIVRIMSDARGAKGPRLSLVPFRSEASGLPAELLAIEAASLPDGAPSRLWSSGGLLGRLLRDHLTTGARLIIDDRRTFDEAAALIAARDPERAASLDLANTEPDLFERHDVHGTLDAAREPVVPFEGGRLVIEVAEALTAIDVDLAGGPLTDVARRAMAIVAREILRRNLGGLIVLDPPRLKAAKVRAAMVEALRLGLKADSAIHQVFGTTAAGLIELTRQRIGESVDDALTEATGPGQARGARLDALGHDLLVAARRAVRAGARRAVISASPALLATIEAAPGLGGEGLARWLGRPVERRTEPNRGREYFEIGSA
ncbi:MAG: hypothetical protein EXQ99_08475 [Alphaproteobacteria bacterium]|nr:hypothetical protein [Alphaproteobacteria bacterium]